MLIHAYYTTSLICCQGVKRKFPLPKREKGNLHGLLFVAGVITPDAKPVRARCTVRQNSFFIRKTHAAPAVVPINGIRIPKMVYSCLLDFAASTQLIRHVRLISGFCSSGYDFVIPSSRLHLAVQTLGVALGFVGNYALVDFVDFHHRLTGCPSY